MAKYEDPKITVSLDDESKALLRNLVQAVNRIAPPEAADVSFATPSKRLAESELPDGDYIQTVDYGGQKYGLYMNGEGDYQLYNDGHAGEDVD